MRYLYYYIIFIVTIIITACAQPVSPTGGATDKEAPKIISVNPANNSIQQLPKKIIINFNENITLNNPSQNITVSPDPGKIKFSNDHRSVTIHLNPDSLSKNTTYSINLNESIADLNEGNKGIYPAILFSTGNSIDTQTITGSIEIFQNPKISNFKTLCYNYENFNTGPYFRNKLTGNQFKISGIDTLPKSVIVFNDLNNDNKNTAGEELGYIRNYSAGKDSLHIPVYTTARRPLELYQNNQFVYIGGLHYFQALFEKERINNAFLFKDTLIIPEADIIKFTEGLNEKYYIKPTLKTEKRNTPVQYSIHSDITDSNRNILISFNEPVLKLNTDLVTCINTTDTNEKIEYTVKILYPNSIKITIKSDARNIRLKIPSSNIELGSGNFKKEISTNIEAATNNGCFHFNNSTQTTKNAVLTGNNKTYQFSVPELTMLNIYVPRGTYNLFFYEDEDKDHHISYPIPSIGYEGENMKQTKNIICKPGFINEIKL